MDAPEFAIFGLSSAMVIETDARSEVAYSSMPGGNCIKSKFGSPRFARTPVLRKERGEGAERGARRRRPDFVLRHMSILPMKINKFSICVAI